MTTKKPEPTQTETELLLIALLLKVGGHDLHDAALERAKTHILVVNRKPQLNGPDLITLGAEPKP